MSHKGFRIGAVVTYLVGNIILPLDDERLDQMTTFELNQFVGSAEYKVVDILYPLGYVNM